MRSTTQNFQLDKDIKKSTPYIYNFIAYLIEINIFFFTLKELLIVRSHSPHIVQDLSVVCVFM